MPGNPIHMDHNFPLKLVQNEENTGKEREAGREPMLVRKEKMNITHHIDVTTFDLRPGHKPLLLTRKGSQLQYASVANVHCVDRIKI